MKHARECRTSYTLVELEVESTKEQCNLLVAITIVTQVGSLNIWVEKALINYTSAEN